MSNTSCPNYNKCHKTVVPKNFKGIYPVNNVNYCTYECADKAYRQLVKEVMSKK